LVPIGVPVANVEVLVVGDGGDLVPPGAVGELLIGGGGVGRGYLNRPDLTAERFVIDPVPGLGKGKRFYRSGDLARWLPDGNLEFVGRVDHQLKIRGFRIEPGEVEACLQLCPSVRAAVVTGFADSDGEKRLVAYVVAKSTLTIEFLRDFLAERLPSHMIPSAFVQLDDLPLTANGKVDRSALPPPEHQRPALNTEFVAPHTTLQQTIGQVWKEVLGLDEVGIDDNFFDLGGHSLLVIRLREGLRKALAIEVRLVDLFMSPTVRAQARLFIQPRSSNDARTAQAVSDGQRRGLQRRGEAR
jgi:hypothetical protein